ncbi:MAG TPA: YkvA family protein [Rhodospirillales bacterium]|jgi:uncharacterized membrane protein YkvA (DUF1232 family)
MADDPNDRGPKPGDEGLVRERFVEKAKRTLGRVPFLEEASAAYYCALDPKTPRHVKAVLIGALAYFIMPVDVVPDFLAMFGYTDDAAVFWAAWRTVAAHVDEGHRERARRLVESLKGDA